MIVSLSWLKDYIDWKGSPEELEEGLTSLGLECTSKTTELSFTNLVLGHVTECEAHPNSDHLFACTVECGDGNAYSVVCGAPNVRKGLKVAFARVGSTLNFGEFKLKKTKLRGIKSEGMICSGKELQFNDDHEGILELESSRDLGTPIEEIMDFKQETVYDIDLTPNRGDCLSHLGVAREIGILQKEKVSPREFTLQESGAAVEDSIEVTLENSSACPRYCARVVRGVKVGPSPQWLVDRLEAVGLRSINNIVDASNYVMLDTGQPNHTFDLNFIESGEIRVRMAKDGEKITLLDESEKELAEHHLLICDGDRPVALGGVMGGLNSGIAEDTQDILIEAAYFSPPVVRKSAKSLGISSDSSKRFERGIDIENVVPAMDQLAAMIVEVAGGEVAKGHIDMYPDMRPHPIVEFNWNECNGFLGVNLSKERYLEIFDLLNFCVREEGDILQVSIPSYRVEVDRRADLFEEVARVIGYEEILDSEQFTSSYIAMQDKHSPLRTMRQFLSAKGFNEHYSNSLVSEQLTRYFNPRQAIEIMNALSKEMSFLRPSLLPGMLQAAAYNLNHGANNFKLFEIGAVHQLNEKKPNLSDETMQIAMMWIPGEQAHWRAQSTMDIFYAKADIVAFLANFRINDVKFNNVENAEFELLEEIKFNRKTIAFWGVPSEKIRADFDIKSDVIVFYANSELIAAQQGGKFPRYKAPVKFPPVKRDLSILVDADIPAEKIRSTILQSGGKLLDNVQLFDLFESVDLGKDKRSLAWSLRFLSEEKILTDKVVDKQVKKIVATLERHFAAKLR